MKKIGFLALALIMAIGMLGVGYAAWRDTITIDGTVSTGNVDINVIGYSATYVYKDLRNDGVFTSGKPVQEEYLIPVGSAVAGPGANDDEAVMTFTGLFPCVDFKADVQLQYVGTIPAKVEVVDIIGTDADAGQNAILEALWVLGMIDPSVYGETERFGAWAEGYLTHEEGTPLNEPEHIPYPLGYQLHNGDQVNLAIVIHLPNDDELNALKAANGDSLVIGPFGDDSTVDLSVLYQSNLMSQTNMEFTGTITVIQWNEYPVAP